MAIIAMNGANGKCPIVSLRAGRSIWAAVRQQHIVGTGYFDDVRHVVTGGTASMQALEGSTENSWFVNRSPLGVWWNASSQLIHLHSSLGQRMTHLEWGRTGWPPASAAGVRSRRNGPSLKRLNARIQKTYGSSFCNFDAMNADHCILSLRGGLTLIIIYPVCI